MISNNQYIRDNACVLGNGRGILGNARGVLGNA